MTDSEVAWIAGIFEGEGCILRHGPKSVRLQLQMCDLDVVQRFRDLVGFGKVAYRPSRKTSKPGYCWANGEVNEVKRLLTTLMPWFGERRKERALWALEHIQGNQRLVN